MNDRQKLLLEGPLNTALIKLAVPITLGNILQTGYFMTDAFWVGRLGAVSVAAVAISFPVTFLVIALGSGLAVAGATLSAQYMGAGRQDQVNHIAAQTIMMIAFTSVILGTVGYLITPLLLTLMGVAPDVYESALGFMRVSFIGIIFVFIFAMFQSLMRGIGQTKLPLLIVLGTVILNFALDPLFIYGVGPIPAMGVMGAALATLSTQAIAAFIGIYILLRGRHGIQLCWRDFHPDKQYIKRAFNLGYPGSIELSIRGLGPMAMSFLATSFGTMTIASYGVGSNIMQVITIPAMGLSMAVSTLVGQNIGAGKIERATKVTIVGTVASFVILTLVGIIAYIFAEGFVSFFVPHDPQVIKDAAHFIRIMCLTWGCIGLQLSIVSAFRASGHMKTGMIIAILSQLVLQFPLAYFLSKHTQLNAVGLWWAFPITNIMTAIVSVYWFSKGKWKEGKLTKEEIEMIEVTDQTIAEDGIH
jgi:putative MATE family efflux protein